MHGSHKRILFLLIVSIGAPAALRSQQPVSQASDQQAPPAASGSTQRSAPETDQNPHEKKILLDVVVAPKSGAAVAGLDQQDFTVLDNKTPMTISSFQAVTGRQAHFDVLIVIDAINTDYTHVAFERNEISRYLTAEAGRLEYPVALVLLTEKGPQIVGNFSTDGNALNGELTATNFSLRAIGRDAGYSGAVERMQWSTQALTQLIASEGARTGRKFMVWLSPGWPLLVSPRNVPMDKKQQDATFLDIVDFSTRMQQAGITLYNVNPLGGNESLTAGWTYESFLKGVSKPDQVTTGNLALQVLAIQSGGRSINFNNDVASALQQCIADAAPYYEIGFVPPPASQPNEYHRLEIKVAKSGLVARTRQGYYLQP